MVCVDVVLFDIFDRDGNGGIDPEEFEFLFSSIASLGVYKGNIARARQDWDTCVARRAPARRLTELFECRVTLLV